MKTASRIASAGTLYGAIVVAGVTGYCWAGIFDCKVGIELKLSEVIIPLLAVALPLMLIGLAVAIAVDYLSNRSFLQNKILLTALIGGMLGIMPRVLAGLFVQPFGSGMYPHVEYLPFAIGGAVAAVAIYVLPRNQ